MKQKREKKYKNALNNHQKLNWRSHLQPIIFKGDIQKTINHCIINIETKK